MFAERALRLVLLCAFLVAQGGAAACPIGAPIAEPTRTDAPAHAHATPSHHQQAPGSDNTTTPAGAACAFAMTCGGVALPVVHHISITNRLLHVAATGAVPLAIDAPVPTIDSPPPRPLV